MITVNNYAAISNQGEREINEDSFNIFKYKESHFFVVADGLGGHGLGEVASKFVVEGFENYIKEDNSISDSLYKVQDDLLEQQRLSGNSSKMKTTITVLRVGANDYEYTHIGDSRIYHFDKSKIVERTLDHSVCQKLVQAKMIKEKDIRNHPDRSKLLKVVGDKWVSNDIEMVKGLISEKTAFLLCSDGFWENVYEKEMCKTLKKSNTAQEWLEAMTTIALKKGLGTNMDNYTCISIKCGNR